MRLLVAMPVREQINFVALKQRISIEQIARFLNLQLRSSGSRYKADGNRTLVVGASTGAFYCYGAKTDGDQLALAEHTRGASIREAAEQPAGRFGNGTPRTALPRPSSHSSRCATSGPWTGAAESSR
jgi:hypothetical protein